MGDDVISCRCGKDWATVEVVRPSRELEEFFNEFERVCETCAQLGALAGEWVPWDTWIING